MAIFISNVNPYNLLHFNGVDNLQFSRQQLANYMGCEANDIVYVTNPSYAVNIIAKSLKITKRG